MAGSSTLDELQKKFEGNQRRYLAPLANELRKHGELDRAIELCRAILPDYPEHLSGYVVFGQALYEAGQPEQATEAFTAALALDPENLIALRHLGDIARDRGDRDGAREWYERVLDADPRNETIAAALQTLDAAPAGGAGASINAASDAGTTPARAPSPTPVSASGFEAPSLDFGVLSAAQPSLPTPPAVAAYQPPAASVSAPASPADAEAADDAVDFDPGFFTAGEETVDTSASILDSPADEEHRADVEALAIDGAHEVEPSELALAAALDAPIIDDPAPPTFENDGAFDFQATALDGDFAVDHGNADEADARDNERTHATEAEGPAAYTPAYGGGFDADNLFGDSHDEAPPAVTPPVDIGLESMEFVAPERPASPTPAGGAPFVTETMAELYLQQGFRDEAVEVYEQLLVASPNDEALRERVELLRRGEPSSMGLTGAHAAIPEPELAESTPAAGAPSANGTPTAREFFAALARRTGEPAPEPEPSDDGGSHAPAEAAASHEQSEPEAQHEHASSNGAGDGSLATLFGSADANPDDERAAAALSALVADGSLHGNGAEAPSRRESATPAWQNTTPQPAPAARAETPASSVAQPSSASRPAARELSLDDVFGAPRPAARSTPNSSFSFDQFFAEGQSSAPVEPTPAPAPAEQAPAAAPADEASDLAQFNAWLEGLKKR